MGKFEKLEPMQRSPQTAHHVVRAPEYMRRPRRGLKSGVVPTLEQNPAIGDEIIQYVRDGMFLREATSMVGIHKATVYDWIKKGRVDHDHGIESAYANFFVGVQAALAEAKYDAVTAVRRAGQNPAFWMAAAWYLERRYPQEFGKQDRLQLQHSGQINSATVGITAALKDEDSRKALADVAAILAKSGIGNDQSDGVGAVHDEWTDDDASTFGLTEPDLT